MSVDKNVTWKEYNGTDYDNLYPTTKDSNVLLSAESKEKLGITDDGATISNAFTGIVNNGAGFAVGDTLTTRRQNLGDKWLLCNGATLQAEQYPELSQLFQDIDLTKSGQWTSYTYDVPRTTGTTIKKVGNYWVRVVGITSAQGLPVALYSSNPKDSSSWQQVANLVDSTLAPYTAMDICYFQNKYVATARAQGSTSFTGSIYYADDLTGPWTALSITMDWSHAYGARYIATDGTRLFVGLYMPEGQTTSSSWSARSSIIWSDTIEGLNTNKSSIGQYGYAIYGYGNMVYADLDDTSGPAYYSESNNNFRRVPNMTVYSVAYPSMVYYKGAYYLRRQVKETYTSESVDFTLYRSTDGVNFTKIGSNQNYQNIMNSIDDYILFQNRLFLVGQDGNLTSAGYIPFTPITSCPSNMNSSDVALLGYTAGTNQAGFQYVNTDSFVIPSISLDKTYTYIKAKT